MRRECFMDERASQSTRDAPGLPDEDDRRHLMSRCDVLARSFFETKGQKAPPGEEVVSDSWKRCDPITAERSPSFRCRPMRDEHPGARSAAGSEEGEKR